MCGGNRTRQGADTQQVLSVVRTARQRGLDLDHRDAARPGAGRSRGLRASAAARVGGHHPHFRIDTRPVPAARRGDGSRAQTPTAGRRPDGLGRARRTVPPPMDATGRKTATPPGSDIVHGGGNPCETRHLSNQPSARLRNCRSRLISGSCLIATRDDELIAAIVKATNRQTAVKEEQLLALNDFQKKLEVFFGSFEESRRLFYERRSRQYNTVPGIEKTRIVTLPNLIRAYAALLLEEPHRTTRTFRALLAYVGTTIFASDHRLEPYYLAASALYRLEFLFRNGEVDPKFKAARYHILMAIRLLGSPCTPPRANSHEMARFCEKLLEVLWNPTDAAALVCNAVDVVDAVAAGNLHRDNIRTEPFTNRVAQRCREIVPAA